MKYRILKHIAIPVLIASHGTCFATEVSNPDSQSAVHSTQTNPNINLQGNGAVGYFFSKSSVVSEGVVGKNGGVVKLGNFLSVFFPEKSLSNGTRVVLSTSMDRDIDLIFNETTLLFRGIERLPQEIRVNIGKQPPSSESVSAELYTNEISDKLKTSHLSVFALIEQGGENETPFMVFDKIEYSFNEKENKLKFYIPGVAFNSIKSTDESYEAIVIFAINS